MAGGGAEASGLAAGSALDAAGAVLTTAAVFGRADTPRLRAMVDEGRRIRFELSALGALRRLTVRRRGEDAFDGATRTLSEISAALTGVADALDPPFRRARSAASLDGALTRLASALDAVMADRRHADEEVATSVTRRIDALAGQVRAAARLLADDEVPRRDRGAGSSPTSAAARRRGWRGATPPARGRACRDRPR